MTRNDETLMDALEGKALANNVQNQNANIDEKAFGGRMGEVSSEFMRTLALTRYLSDMARENHLSNRIYIHDLDWYVCGAHNCLSIPFDDLLAKGFKTRQADVRPANSINTAFQLVAVIMQLQTLQQFGGVSATHLDWTMVPYVRKSFAKHYKDGLKYIDEVDEIETLPSPDTSIEDAEYKTRSEKAYNYALNLTKRELKQAVEALFHNLK